MKYQNLVPHTTLLGKKVWGHAPPPRPHPSQFCRPCISTYILTERYNIQGKKGIYITQYYCIEVITAAHSKSQMRNLTMLSTLTDLQTFLVSCRLYTELQWFLKYFQIKKSNKTKRGKCYWENGYLCHYTSYCQITHRVDFLNGI